MCRWFESALGHHFFLGSILVTWFTFYTGHMVYTFSGVNGFVAGSTRFSLLSKKPKS